MVESKTAVGFNAWFNALPLILKILVIIGIVVGSFAVGASFVASTLRAWKLFGERMERRGQKKKDKD
jgi:hypothetical protein